MMWRPPLMLLPADGAELIQNWGATWGQIATTFDRREELCVVSSVSNKDSFTLPTNSAWQGSHYLRYATSVSGTGLWYQVKPELHEWHAAGLRRGGLPIELSSFQSKVVNGWRLPPPGQQVPILTWSRNEGQPPLWTVWWVSQQGAQPGLLDVVDDRLPLTDLSSSWPVGDLGKSSVAIVGLGSIGSVIAETLAVYAVGQLTLIDPDRYLRHNVVRHRLGGEHIGRYKVTAMADHLKSRFPYVKVKSCPNDVIIEADLMRPIFSDADVVVGATDGIASRRVINHLARRAGVPAVLACVLESGALDEIIRVRRQTGCLLCYRESLKEKGSINPEPALDQEYDLGPPHLPMTAVAGDLAVIGTLAAKIVVATILERLGHWNQRLPGDVVTVGLRPIPNLPHPFDIEEAGVMRWSEIGSSSPSCPTCTPA